MDEISKKVLEEYSRLKAWEEEYGNDDEDDEIDEDEYREQFDGNFLLLSAINHVFIEYDIKESLGFLYNQLIDKVWDNKTQQIFYFSDNNKN